MKYNSQLPRTRAVVTRLIRLIVETGSLTGTHIALFTPTAADSASSCGRDARSDLVLLVPNLRLS